MNVFYIITNHQKDENDRITNEIQSYLQEHGCKCYVHNDCLSVNCQGNYHFTNAELIPEDVECVLVLGGDGTLIQAARDIVNKRVPLLGINLGTLGFLTEIEVENVYTALDNLMKDEYNKESRMMLHGVMYHNNKAMFSDIALNDIVLNRSGALRIVEYDIYVNDEFLYTCHADGIIISTPTGSTGYNLSAGGPIVSPKSSLILLTPICSHSLHSESIVLSGEDKVVVKIGLGRKNSIEEAEVTFDGDQSIKLVTGDYVEITQAKETTELLKLSSISFLEVLRKKMQ
ncbi:MAG: NAD(+)/NADH kinase [Lachnospiraceae bacterium]